MDSRSGGVARSRHAWTALAVAVALLTPAFAQSTRRLTTVDGLRQFSGYFHLQQVVVRGTLVETGSRRTLRTDEHEIRLLIGNDVRVSPGPVELRGAFYDVGKLEAGDVRLAGYHRPDDDPWPRPGEELVLIVTSATVTTPGAPLSLRVLALEPWRFDGQSVTLVGQFRGRNLFGDLPGTPRKSQYDFVLKSGDAAVWVTGLRPRGKGFDLDVDARVDTSQWLEVTGVVGRAAGLVTVQATRFQAAEEPSGGTEREAPLAPPPPSPPVEVVFSSLTMGETDVPPGASVRFQFSRNIKPETVKDHLRVSYVGAAPDAASPEWQTSYDSAARALEVKFSKPLESFRTVKIELLDGIVGFDGVPLIPWTLTFSVGN